MEATHLLLIDPIAYPGGSKVATSHALDLLEGKKVRITVVTRDLESWSGKPVQTSGLYEPRFLSSREQGIGYFLRHLVIVGSILLARIRFGKFDIAIGASGPGIDLSLYLARRVLRYPIVQLIHGPVARSRTIGRALLSARRVFYLESMRSSLLAALQVVEPNLDCEDIERDQRYVPFVNGLPVNCWPSLTNQRQPRLFWAASLLRWKGLTTLIEALKILEISAPVEADICFLRPRETREALGPGPVDIRRTRWYENPADLDRIRSNCSFFVSTSSAEPFGLSILESMAAGLAVIIPRDGAYWDRILTDELDCLKYRPGDAKDLSARISYLQRNPGVIGRLAEHSRNLAQNYCAESCYAEIAGALTPVRPGIKPAVKIPGPSIDHARS